jgi:hypothetical protein
LRDFDERILEFGNEEAQVWGRLRVPYHEKRDRETNRGYRPHP